MILEIDIGAGFVPVSCLTDVSENETVELIGTTTRQNGSWKTSRPISQNKTISINGLLPVDTSLFTWEDLATLKRNRTQFSWRIDDDSGVGFITELTLEGTDGGDVTFSATIQNSGKPISGPPAGYTVAFYEPPFTGTTFAWDIINGEIGATYNATVTSSGGGTPYTKTGTVTSENMRFLAQPLAGLNPGTLTIELTLTNANGTGAVATDTAQFTAAPTGYSVAWETKVSNLAITGGTLRVTGNTIGDTINFTVTSSGGGTPVTGSLVSTASPQGFSVGLSTLPDGDLTGTVTLTNGSGTGAPVNTPDTIERITSPDNAGPITTFSSASIPARENDTIGSSGWSNDGAIGVDFEAVTVDGADVDSGIWALRITNLVSPGFHGRIYTVTGLTPGDIYNFIFRVKSDDGAGGAGDANLFILQDAGNIDIEYNNLNWEEKTVVVTVRSGGSIPFYFYPSFGPTVGHRSFWNDLRLELNTDPIPALSPAIYFNPSSIDPTASVDGNNVNVWNDLSGNALNASAAGAGQPTLRVSGTGRQVVFDGNSYFDPPASALTTFTGGTDEFTLIIREGDIVQTPTGTGAYMAAKAGGSTASRNYALYYQDNSPAGLSAVWAFGQFYHFLNRIGPNRLIIAKFFTNRVRIWVDGLLVVDGPLGVDLTATTIRFQIAAGNNGNVLNYNGNTLDLVAIIPSAISEAQQQSIESEWQINAIDPILATNPIMFVTPETIDNPAKNNTDNVSNWYDASGNQLDAAVGSPPAWLFLGAQSRQVEFRGGTWFNFANDPLFNLVPGTDEFTLIVREGDTKMVGGYIMGLASNGSTGRQYSIYVGTVDDYEFAVGGTGHTVTLPITPNKLIIMRVTTTEIDVWVDGVQRISGAAIGTLLATAGTTFNIGSRTNGSLTIDAPSKMDLGAVIPKAITPAERNAIENQYQINATPTPSGYALAWDSDPIGSTTPGLTLTAGNGEGTAITGVITSSGGGSPVNVNETFASTPFNFTVNVASLPNGTLTANLTVTGPGGTQTITPPPTTTKNL